MKLLSCFNLLFCLITGCINETDQFLKAPDGIVGTWKMVESHYSYGGPLQHESISNGPEITFMEDFTFLTPSNTPCKTGIYQLKNELLVMNYNCEENYEGLSEVKLRLKFEENRMLMIPVDPICIEGCSSVYEKLNE